VVVVIGSSIVGGGVGYGVGVGGGVVVVVVVGGGGGVSAAFLFVLNAGVVGQTTRAALEDVRSNSNQYHMRQLTFTAFIASCAAIFGLKVKRSGEVLEVSAKILHSDGGNSPVALPQYSRGRGLRCRRVRLELDQ